MLFRPDLVGGWLGVNAPLLLQFIGAGLLLFAGDLVHQATRPRMASWRALPSSLADFGWVVGTAMLLVLFPALLSSTGTLLALAVAVLVLLLGIFQIVGIDRLHRSPDGRLHRHCIRVAVGVPAEAMWAAVSRLGEISRHMPMLRSSRLRDDAAPGPGCVRECEDRSGKRWAEECTLFHPEERRFDVEFLCDEPGFPFPASEMRGGWQVVALDTASCEVMVWWELRPRPHWLAPFMLPLLAFQADRDFPRVIHSMALSGTAATPSGGRSARLLPRFC